MVEYLQRGVIEMGLAKFQLLAPKIYKKISKPLQLHDGSTYIVAVVEEKKPWEIHLYEFADTKVFQADPERFLTTFDDPLNLAQAFGFADSSIYMANKAGYRVSKRKIIPDTVENRQIVQTMLQTDPHRASGIFLLTKDERLFHYEDFAFPLSR